MSEGDRGTERTEVNASASEPRPARARADTLVPRDDGPRYVELSQLGEGGMGVVSLVHDRQIRRDVAIKRLSGGSVTNPTARQRFAREARLQGRLEHPAIVPVYDLDESPDGVPFFTMKRVKGESLRDILAKLAARDATTTTKWSRRRLLRAFSQLALAVHYAHEHGVVHRDIKPDNIMLGAYGEVYLLDWGIAKSREERDVTAVAPTSESDDSGELTQVGTVLGTVRYMAPEQARGAAPSPQFDVFALGAILFELLAGEPLRQGSRAEQLRLLRDSTVDVYPSHRAKAIDVPPELDELVAHSLAPEPAHRLEDALVLSISIDAFLDGDRDLELRRAAADRHALAGRIAATRALEVDDHDARARALHELGKALTLEPNNADAAATLLQLLTTPPAKEPAEVAEAREKERRRRLRQGGMAGGLLYLYVSINLYTTYLLGVRDWSVVLVAHGLWGAALAASAYTIWRPSYAGLVAMFLSGTAASVYVAEVYSPFLMVPGFLAVHATLYALASVRALRLFVIVAACVGWTVAVFGERWGLFADTVQFVNGAMHISSPAIGLPELGTTVYLYIAGLGLLVLPAAVVAIVRTSHERVDRQIRMQSWQLRQLVRRDAELATRSSDRRA